MSKIGSYFAMKGGMIGQIPIVFACIIAAYGAIKLRKNSKTCGKKKHFTWPNEEEIPNYLHNMKEWQEVGEVNQLYVYPLLSVSRRIMVKEYSLNFERDSPTVNNLTYQDNMFVVYDKDTKYVQTDKILKFICMTIEGDAAVKFSAPTMSSLILDMKEIMKEVDLIECVKSQVKRNFIIKMKFTDCGDEASRWISKYLTKTNIGLGYIIQKSLTQKTFWSLMKDLYTSYNDTNDKPTEVSHDFLPECRLLLLSSLKKSYEANTHTKNSDFYDIQFNPNIVIHFTKPLEDNDWNLIRIGDVILKNIKPWMRPESKISSKHVLVEINAEALLNCHVVFPGVVRQSDNVYICTHSKLNISGYIFKYLRDKLNFFNIGW